MNKLNLISLACVGSLFVYAGLQGKASEEKISQVIQNSALAVIGMYLSVQTSHDQIATFHEQFEEMGVPNPIEVFLTIMAQQRAPGDFPY